MEPLLCTLQLRKDGNSTYRSCTITIVDSIQCRPANSHGFYRDTKLCIYKLCKLELMQFLTWNIAVGVACEQFLLEPHAPDNPVSKVWLAGLYTIRSHSGILNFYYSDSPR